jgi:hypothetical protein
MADEQKERYLDENLTDEEKESGRLRQPSEEGERVDTSRDTKFDTTRPDRPDEFGDGDRRS